MGLSPAAVSGLELASALIVRHNTILFLMGVMVLLGVGVLIGSSLHTRSIDEKYRRLAQRVRYLNDRETALDARGHPAAICGSCPMEISQGTLLIRERRPLIDED